VSRPAKRSVTKRKPSTGAKKASSKRGALDSYWTKRVRSAGFRKALVEALRLEIETLAATPVGKVIDRRAVSKALVARASKLADRAAIADLVVQVSGLLARKLSERGSSLIGLLDDDLAARIESILAEDLVLSKPMEHFIGDMMGQEFVQGLFTDIIYTSIVSFNQRVNPLFGRMTMMALEDQLKGFIGIFMPMVQKEAVAFATSRANQAVFFDFMRAMIRHLLNQPISGITSTVSSKQRKKGEEFIRQAIGNAGVESLVGDMAVAMWEGLYGQIKNRKVGDLFHLTEHATWLAERGADLILPMLARPSMVHFAGLELARAPSGRS
jgi:hypothetical protein